MKNILFVVLLIIVNVTIVFSQAVYSCEYKSDADVKIYVTKYKSDADLVVYKCTYKSDAEGNPPLADGIL